MTQEIIYEKPFDALEAATIAHRDWFSMFMWLHAERVELSQAYVSYKLTHDYLGKIGEIRIRKLDLKFSQIELDDSPSVTKDQIYNDLIQFLADSESTYFRGMDNPRLLRLQELVQRFELATERKVLGKERPSSGKWWTRREEIWVIITKEMEGKRVGHEFYVALDKEIRERKKEVKELSHVVIEVFMFHLNEDLAFTLELEKEKTVTRLDSTSLSPPDVFNGRGMMDESDSSSEMRPHKVLLNFQTLRDAEERLNDYRLSPKGKSELESFRRVEIDVLTVAYIASLYEFGEIGVLQLAKASNGVLAEAQIISPDSSRVDAFMERMMPVRAVVNSSQATNELFIELLKMEEPSSSFRFAEYCFDLWMPIAENIVAFLMADAKPNNEQKQTAPILPPITDPTDQRIYDICKANLSIGDKEIGQQINLSRVNVNRRRNKLHDMGHKVKN